MRKATLMPVLNSHRTILASGKYSASWRVARLVSQRKGSPVSGFSAKTIPTQGYVRSPEDGVRQRASGTFHTVTLTRSRASSISGARHVGHQVPTEPGLTNGPPHFVHAPFIAAPRPS